MAVGLEQNRTAMQALGYRQAVAFLRGECSLDQTIERVKARTRQFARRQMTWFRRQMQGTRLPVQPGEPAEETADRILKVLSGEER
jgi:tRNA dimethylallyltransferase